jgi:hypothetical protein
MTVFEKRRRRRRKQAGKRKIRWEAKVRQAIHHQRPAHAPSSCKRIGKDVCAFNLMPVRQCF